MPKDPGRTLPTARLFQVGITNRTLKESLSATDQIDIWKVNTKRRSSINLTLGGMNRASNADVSILNASGRVIRSSVKRGNRAELLRGVEVEAGTFYVRVNLQKKAATKYALTLSATPTQDQLGNSFETATPLSSSTGTYSDFVGDRDLNDFLGFGSLVAGQFSVSLTGLSDDANLELYDGNRKLLFSSNNPGTANESINQRLTGIAGSNYFVRVVPAAGKNASYSLNYSFTVDTPTKTASGLQYIDLSAGTGASPTTGQTVTVQYTGILTNGFKFDSSRDRNQPFSFKIGKGQVIKGWDEGISNMKVGGRRQLIIPASLAYGSQGSGSIPPNATLIFDVEVLSITNS